MMQFPPNNGMLTSQKSIEGGLSMRGSICTGQKCECGEKFVRLFETPTLTVIACPLHNNVFPTRYYLDIYHKGERYKIRRDEKGQLLSSNDMASALLAEIRRQKRFSPDRYVQRKLEPFFFKNVVKIWLEDSEYRVQEGDLSEGAYAMQQSYSKRLFVPYFQQDDIRSIEDYDINDFRKTLTQSPRTKNTILDYLQMVFAHAKSRKMIDEIPVVKRQKVKKKPPKVLDIESQERVLSYIEEKHQPIFRFGQLTGCRKSEAIALQWEDINFADGYILFQHNISGGKFVDRLKEGDGDAKVFPLIASLRELLHPRQLTGYVFKNPRTNKPYSKNLNSILDRAFLEAGVPRIPLENFFRHSFASNALEDGVQLKTVSALLGHSNESITERHYIKMRVNKLGEVLELRDKTGTNPIKAISK